MTCRRSASREAPSLQTGIRVNILYKLLHIDGEVAKPRMSVLTVIGVMAKLVNPVDFTCAAKTLFVNSY